MFQNKVILSKKKINSVCYSHSSYETQQNMLLMKILYVRALKKVKEEEDDWNGYSKFNKE